MLGKRMNNLQVDESTFLSCEKDLGKIINMIFVENKIYSDKIKRLLVISNKDCLDATHNQEYVETISKMSVKSLLDKGYINTTPRLELKEHDEVMNKIIITFDNFIPNANNPHFKNNIITIDILCHNKNWDLGDYRLRPIKIAGYIDSILNNARLTGIGTLQFMGMNLLTLNEYWSGYSIVYQAIHGNDDKIGVE